MHKASSTILVFLLLGALTFAAYSNSLNAPFIWDDIGLIVRNPLIQDWHNSYRVFSKDLFEGTVASSNFYRPLQALSFIWDYYFWQLEPFGYHLTNLLLQALVSFLVFLFILLITSDFAVALLSASFFSVSPLNTEAVTYISGRAEMLMGLFLLLSFLLFALAQNKGGRHKAALVVLSCVSFILALLSKELALVFPLAIFGYLYYFSRDRIKRLSGVLALLMPFFAVSAGYIILRLAVLDFSSLRPPALAQYPLLLRITVLPKIILTYLRLLILPVNLHMSWTISRPETTAGIFLCWFMLGAASVFCWRILSKKGGNEQLCFLLLWALVFFIPQSGIFPINAFIAEHFVYLPSVSYFVLLAFLLKKYLNKRLFVFLGSSLVVFYGLLTFARNADWKDPFVFYEKIILLSPQSFQAHNNLGLEYEYRGMFKNAAIEYEKALKIKPDLIEARSNLANIYFKTRNLSEAKREYELVKRDAPALKLGEVENNLGCIYELEGNWDKAIESYNKALELDPGLNFTRFNIAKIYQASGRLDEAATQISLSLAQPGRGPTCGKACLVAVMERLKAAKIASAASFYNDLGIELAGYSELKAAVASFRRALELDPKYADACFNLGLAHWNLGQKKEAAFAFRQALRIDPNHLKSKEFLSSIIRKK